LAAVLSSGLKSRPTGIGAGRANPLLVSRVDTEAEKMAHSADSLASLEQIEASCPEDARLDRQS